MTTVYLLHFDAPISAGHTTQHYLGSADDLRRRITEHRLRPDARLLQVAKERGIGFTLARVWTGKPRDFERTLKRRKCGPKLCPICNQAHEQLDLFLDFELADVPELEF